jgi:hypothetical protein
MIVPRTRERGGSSEWVIAGTNESASGVLATAVPRVAPRLVSHYVTHEVCNDEIHPKHPNEGGPFDCRKVVFDYQPSASVVVGQDFTYQQYGVTYVSRAKYSGVYYVPPPNGMLLPNSCVAEAKSYGATAWSRMTPAKPKVSLGVFLAELRDFKAMLKLANKLKSYRDLGGKYLNVEFGWKPFISDVRRLYASIIALDDQIARLRKQNGAWMKHGGNLASTVDFSSTDCNELDSLSYVDQVIGKQYTTTKLECWCEGKFRYYIPGLDNPRWGRAKAILKLWDLDIGPSQLYELIPFSWLFDWFANFGDIVKNYCTSVEDNVAAKYAYVMLHKSHEVKREVSFRTRFRSGQYTGYKYTSNKARTTVIQDSKTRVVANPFGFSFNFGDITPRQIAILAALGLSRLRF